VYLVRHKRGSTTTWAQAWRRAALMLDPRLLPSLCEPVAQLDRVTVSEAVGRWFDSSRVRHKKTKTELSRSTANYSSLAPETEALPCAVSNSMNEGRE